MDTALDRRLRDLRANYERVVGRPFVHFFCPLLFRDEDVELCRAHIINAAFSESNACTIQRKDVDNFYGAMFESDFVDLRHRGRPPVDVVVDEVLSKRFRPKFVVEGREVDYYVPKGPVPGDHSPFVLDGKSGPIRIALKIHPNETRAFADSSWQIQIEKDVRIAAVVSVLKAAHLTLFNMLGYEYALSPGGHLLGRAVLGEFYLENRDRPRSNALARAVPHFRQFAHMVRPVVGAPTTL